MFADLIDGPWTHMPSGIFPANAAWTVLAAIAHNLLRVAGTLTATHLGKPAAPPCDGNSSTCPPGSPASKAHPPCTYPNTGHTQAA